MNDEKLTVAVIRFEGEDLAGAERAKLQREQAKAWLQQQIQEKEAADKERKAAEAVYREAILARDQRALQLDTMEKQCRKRLEEACIRFNKALVCLNFFFPTILVNFLPFKRSRVGISKKSFLGTNKVSFFRRTSVKWRK